MKGLIQDSDRLSFVLILLLSLKLIKVELSSSVVPRINVCSLENKFDHSFSSFSVNLDGINLF